MIGTTLGSPWSRWIVGSMKLGQKKSRSASSGVYSAMESETVKNVSTPHSAMSETNTARDGVEGIGVEEAELRDVGVRVHVRDPARTDVHPGLEEHQVGLEPVAHLVVVTRVVDELDLEEEPEAGQVLGQLVQEELRLAGPGPAEEQEPRLGRRGRR